MDAQPTKDEALAVAQQIWLHRPFMRCFIARWPDETGWHAFCAPDRRKALRIVRQGGEAEELKRA